MTGTPPAPETPIQAFLRTVRRWVMYLIPKN